MKLRKLISLLLAVMILTTGIMASALAGSGEDQTYRERVKEFEIMKQRKIWVEFNAEETWYRQKAQKLYARRITGVAPDGSWELGPWELVHDQITYQHDLISLEGTCFAFAYSFDIVWGTDWPYSGVFWSNPDVHPDSIRIMLSGTVRMAGIKITMDGKTIVNESNCSSHSEWRP